MITLLDGPLGTELAARGVQTDLPLWSAAAITEAPDMIAQIHRDYAAAGATVHTANTFRTKRRSAGDHWESLARKAVTLARDSIGADHRLAGSIAPLEDCYRPDLSPPSADDEHHELAEVLADAGCDLLLCETFANISEALAAVRAAVSTGVETWVAFTAGPHANLLTPAQMVGGAKQAIAAGATAVLVNCTPAVDTLRYVTALSDAEPGVPIGAYANAGEEDDQIGWKAATGPGAERYAELAESWAAAGATLIGGCCGTRPSHIKRLDAIFG